MRNFEDEVLDPSERLHTDASFQRIVISRLPYGAAKGNALENPKGWSAQIEWNDNGVSVSSAGSGRTITEAIERAIRK